jgi:release factor glutamine methyltransferase
MSRAVAARVRQAADRLARAGVPSSAHDAWALFEHATGLTRTRLLLLDDEAAAGLAGLAEFDAYVARRAAREPLQHITGQAHFRSLTLQVGAGVFTPRPETELVAGAAIDAARRLPSPVVVDLCTGSGAIALAVAAEVPQARVLAVELDEPAYAWAARNCAGTAVELRHGDVADAFPDLDGAVDVVVSNPPYIPVDATIRDPEVAAHDPALALWSGADGLDAIRVVEGVAARLLRPGGVVIVEHADLQGDSAPGVFLGAGRWADVRDHADLNARPRFVTAVASDGTSVES